MKTTLDNQLGEPYTSHNQTRERFFARNASAVIDATNVNLVRLLRVLKFLKRSCALQVLTENYRALDTELNKQLAEARNDLALARERLAHYELLEKELDEAVVSAAEGEDTRTYFWVSLVYRRTLERTVEE